MPKAKLTSTLIEAAITGFEAQKKAIDSQIAELRAMLTGAPAESTATVSAARKRRKFSAAARKRMRDAQRLRWAKIRGEATAAPAKAPAKAARKKAAGNKAS